MFVKVFLKVLANKYLQMIADYHSLCYHFVGIYSCIPRHSGTETSRCASVGNHLVCLCWNTSSLAHHIAAVQGIRIELNIFIIYTKPAMSASHVALISMLTVPE